MMLQSGQPRTIGVSPNDSSGVYEEVDIYNGDKYSDETLYLRLKTGVNFGFMRVGLFEEKAKLEFALSGALNTVFQGFGGADNLGFDGIFFFGPQLRLFDRISIKAGLQHYSGHYGDETVDNYYAANSPDPLRDTMNFTRDNNLLVGIEAELIDNLFFHIEATRPRINTWMSPSVHIPTWVLKPSNGEPLNPQEASSENVDAMEYPDSYKAWTIQSGASYEMMITKQFGLNLSADVRLHQDGKTLHQIDGYSDDNPWEAEYTIGGGITLKELGNKHTAKINFTYHNGRFPLLNYFYQRSSYMSIAAQIL